MTGKVVKMPDASVILDLDNEERPEEEVKPPFVVNVGGKKITFTDPAEIEWRALASVVIPGDLIRISLSKEDRDHLKGLALSSWKFNKLMKGYYDHYDLEDKIAEAKRQEAIGL